MWHLPAGDRSKRREASVGLVPRPRLHQRVVVLARQPDLLLRAGRSGHARHPVDLRLDGERHLAHQEGAGLQLDRGLLGCDQEHRVPGRPRPRPAARLEHELQRPRGLLRNAREGGGLGHHDDLPVQGRLAVGGVPRALLESGDVADTPAPRRGRRDPEHHAPVLPLGGPRQGDHRYERRGLPRLPPRGADSVLGHATVADARRLHRHQLRLRHRAGGVGGCGH
mmetsp:Transcript_17874/g.50910  ORF Transcript_17874/g.50910 Transcript_17874/m.50910 type:complete len:224 (-) Transcript_17874:378-1049(-)